jgi:hypothetical protein
MLVAVCLMGQALLAQESPDARPGAKLRPPDPAPVAADDLEAAIGRGVKFLVEHQNRDGSWGSPALKGGVPIYAGIGSHHAFGVAVTALCVSALIESSDTSADVVKAIERGEQHLFEQLPKVRRDDPVLIYNVWTHAYGIQALVRMDRRLPDDAARRKRIRELIEGQYEKLTKYESVEGGWGYYDFDAGTQRPASSSTSFVNAAVLVAMHEADRIGIPPPEKILQRALKMTKAQRLPDGSYLYGYYLHKMPTHPINEPGGSLGRSQACALSLRVWGEGDISDEMLKTWLDRLVTRNGWLSLGRKKPIPHESFFAVAGYFFYFGHYYAGLCIEQLPPSQQPFYKHHIARIVLDLQEADGSWFDYPLYNYHKPYGTAFALMTLNSCRAEPQQRLPKEGAETAKRPNSESAPDRGIISWWRR